MEEKNLGHSAVTETRYEKLEAVLNNSYLMYILKHAYKGVPRCEFIDFISHRETTIDSFRYRDALSQ